MSHDGDFRKAIELTERSDALFAGLDRPWDQATNWLFAARATISADDEERSVNAVDQVQQWLRTVDDPWLHAREAVLGELARIQHRFDDAVVHLGRAAETSRRLGFLQTEAYQLSGLGRAQCQAGDYESGAATLGQAIEKAEATGDVRLAALARVHYRARAAGTRPRRGGRAPSSKRRLRGIAPPGVANRLRSATACSPRWTRRIGNRAPRTVSSPSSTRPDSTTTPTSRSSPSTRWPRRRRSGRHRHRTRPL